MAIGIVNVASGTDDVQGLTASGGDKDAFARLCGFSIAETAESAAVAEVILHHGTSSSGARIMAPINLAADGFGTFWYPPGIPVPQGIYVNRVSGTSELVFYVEWI